MKINCTQTTKFLLGILAVIMALLGHTQAQSFLTNGLVGYYPFQGNANDASGNGNNGTAEGPTLTTNQLGQPNSAYYFNGTDIIDIPSSPDFNYYPEQGLTVTAWVLASANLYPEHLVGRRNDDYGSFWQLAIGPGAASSIPIGQWTHVVVTLDGSAQTFYTNGVFNQTGAGQTGDGTPVTNNIDVYIGGSAEYQRFEGTLDDVRIYNRVLSTNEITLLYLIEQGTPFAPTFLQSPSDEIISPGQGFVFTAQAVGSPNALTYQWQFSTNGLSYANINGATEATYSQASSGTTNIGYYRVVASNSVGSKTSGIAILSFIHINMLAAVYVTGPIGTQYQIQSTPAFNPTNWAALTNVTIASQPYIYVDYSTPTNSNQFYRAVPQ